MGADSAIVLFVYVLVIIGMMYFFVMRPNKKNKEKRELLLSKIEKGDAVLTSGGFYGRVIAVENAVLIVEFGNNKNCRIPVRKDAIVEVEKVGEVKQQTEDKKSKNTKKGVSETKEVEEKVCDTNE